MGAWSRRPCLRGHDGALGESQLREIKRLYGNLKCREPLIDGGQDVLAFWASRMPFEDFTKLTVRARAVADPDGRNRDHDRAHAERAVSTAIVGADFFLRARNGTAAGAEMIKILDDFAEEEFQADLAELKQRCGENAPMIMLRRTAAQRRADALSRIFKTAAAATGKVDVGGAVVNFVTDLRTFTTAVAELFGVDPDQIGVDTGATTAMVPSGPLGVSGRELFARAAAYRSETTSGIPVDPRVIAAAAINGRSPQPPQRKRTQRLVRRHRIRPRRPARWHRDRTTPTPHIRPHRRLARRHLSR